jgi:iron complex outermembrane receptor protein
VLRNDLAGTFSKTEWVQDISQSDLGDDDARVVNNGVKASQLLVDKGLVGTYFNQESRIYLEQAVPRVKVTLSNTLDVGKLSVYLRNTYFGETTEASTADIFDADLNLRSDANIDPYNSPKILTDLSFGYQLLENLGITIGGQNILDVYPDLVDPAFVSSGRFLYSRSSPQFSFGGRHLFARLAFTLQ